MSPSAYAVILGLGIFAIAGFQTIQYRESLSILQQEFDKAPIYIILEIGIAAALSLWGASGLAGSLKPINPLAAQRGLDAQSFRPDFMSFRHRGHITPLIVAPLPSRS